MTQILERLIDRDTADLRGNGLQPVPDTHRLITSLHEAGRPIPDIALAVEVEIEDVMAVLGVDWRCSCCGNAADLSDGRTAWGADGDQGVPFWGTGGCGCEAMFLDRRGNEYVGDSPYREEAY